MHIVDCVDGMEDECRAALVSLKVAITHEIHKTNFFGICINSSDEGLLDIIKKQPTVSEISPDPKRYPIRATKSKNKDGLSRVLSYTSQEDAVPYGIDLVKAREFWDEYNVKGDNVKVCVIDSGLDVRHPDFDDTSFPITGYQDGNGLLAWVCLHQECLVMYLHSSIFMLTNSNVLLPFSFSFLSFMFIFFPTSSL